MAAAALLCRQAGLLGASFDQTTSSILVTVQGDGVTLYSLEQKQLGSLTLGSRRDSEFQVAGVYHRGLSKQSSGEQQHFGIVISTLHDRATNNHTLCLSCLDSRARPIADAQSRVALPGPAHSCHVLTTYQQRKHPSEDAASRSAAVVVLADGRVGVTALGPDGFIGPLHLPQETSDLKPRHIRAVSSRDTLLVASQTAAGVDVTLRVLRYSHLAQTDSGTVGLSQVKTTTLTCPGGDHTTIPTGLTTSSAYSMLQWSNGYATVVHGMLGVAASPPLRACTFPLADAVLANGTSSSAFTPTATESGRKRKSSAAVERSTYDKGALRMMCAAVDDQQFVVLDFESAAAESQVCYSLHDAQFGCPLSSGVLDIDAPLLCLNAMQCDALAVGSDVVVLRLGSSVHTVRIRTQPVSLLSLVARLSVSSTAGAEDAATGKLRSRTGIGGASVVKPLVELPAQVWLEQELLSCKPLDRGLAAANGDDHGMQDVLEVVPAAAVHRVDDICNSLVEQLSKAMQATTPVTQALLNSVVSYLTGRRQHGMAVPPQLLSLTARGLAASKQWSQLGVLLQHIPQGGLSGCSELLVAVAAAHQYSLLSRVVVCLDDVGPGALVDTIQVLLVPTTRSNYKVRQQHYSLMRASAEAIVTNAEWAIAHNIKGAIPLAQCAAAAVDGFSYREVLLHPILALPVDAPTVQVALQRLSPSAVDSLLLYLAKWVNKFTCGAIGDAAFLVAVPTELLFPYFHQILEWTRMTIDAQLARLLVVRSAEPALKSLQMALSKAVKYSESLIKLQGALEHVQAAAQLPVAHLSAVTHYTAEALDLRVR